MVRSRTLCLAIGLALALPLLAQAQQSPLKGAVTGAPELKSIEAISFAPGGVLLIGDGTGSQVVSVETGDIQSKSWVKKEVADIKEQLAGRLGTTAKNIQLGKMAVNPASQTAYIIVRNLNNKKDVIMTVDGDGKINEFPLDKVKYVRIQLPGGAQSSVSKVTDITWAKDRVLVAAQASETFESAIVSIPAPLEHNAKGSTFSTETYHVAHKKWETKAPIRTVVPYEENGKQQIVGSFTCTPIVKYPVEEVKPGAKVKGTSVIELGNGNTPQDMFIYKKGGKTYILMNTMRNPKFHKSNPVGPSPYWTAKVDIAILGETDKINEKAVWRVKGKASDSLTEFAVVVPEYHGVTHMDRLGDNQALVIRTDDKDGYTMAVLALP